MSEDNNTERLLGKLLAQTDNIERELRDIRERQLRDIKNAQDKLADEHERRIATLELNYASASGGMRMLILLCGAAATVGGALSAFIAKYFS